MGNPFSDYRISSPFGWRSSPISGSREFHTGIDLVTTRDGPIYAFTEGIVVKAFEKEAPKGSGFGGYGIVVAIRDKNNRLQVYAHLSAAVVKDGQTVTRGQMIGRQGSTGRSTGQHLHYEVRRSAQSGVPYGWEADRERNCLEPTSYLQGFYPQAPEKEEEQPMTKEERQLLDSLQKTVEAQSKAIEALQERLKNKPAPTWAEPAMRRYGGYMHDHTGTIDLFRILAIMDNIETAKEGKANG